MNRTLWAAWGGLLACLLPAALSAQALEGTVRDRRGEALPGVNVVVVGTVRGAATDATGAYRFGGLALGTHTVEFRGVGYARLQRRVTLTAAETRLDVVLREEDVAGQEVVVQTDASEALRRGVQSGAVLTEADLAAVRGQTLGDVLERVSGVTTLTTGPGISKPVVRGLHSERVVVVNAGVRQEGQQWGGEHAPEIDPFAPARVEVLRGVAGVEYGVGAIGGVVRVVPRALPERPGVGGLVQVNAFSNSRQGAASLLVEGASAAVPGLAARVQGSLRRAGDAQAPGYGLANTGVFERTASADVGLHRARWGAGLHYSRFATTLGVYRGAHVASPEALRTAIAAGRPLSEAPFTYTIEAPRQEVTHDLVTVEAHRASAHGDRAEVRYGYQFNQRQEYDRHFRFQTTPEGTLAFDLGLHSHTLDVRLQHRPVRGFVGSVGVSGMNQANRNGAAGQLIPNFRALSGGMYVRQAYVAGPLRVEAGVRYDARRLDAYPRDRAAGAFRQATTTNRAFTGALGAVYALGRGLSLAANVATAWRPPSVNELYSYGVHHGTAQFEVGDAALGAEYSRGLDATLRYGGARVRGELSVYRTGFRGFLYLPPDTALVTTIRGTFPLRTYTATDARLYGLDGTVAMDVSAALTFSAGGSLVRGDDQGRREPLAGMPADHVRAGIAWHLHGHGPVREADLDASARVVARQSRVPSIPDFAPPPPGYALLDLSLRTTLRIGGRDVMAAVGVDNVLDTAYRDYLSRYRLLADDPGRSFAFRVALPFGAYRL